MLVIDIVVMFRSARKSLAGEHNPEYFHCFSKGHCYSDMLLEKEKKLEHGNLFG